MRVHAHKNMNLHLPNGKLVHVKKGTVHEVPDEVADGANFDLIVDSGALTVLKSSDELADSDAEIARMLKDFPNHQAEIEDARISGSPLHLVYAKLAAQEATTNGKTEPAEILNVGTGEVKNETESKSDEDLEDEDAEDLDDETEDDEELDDEDDDSTADAIAHGR